MFKSATLKLTLWYVVLATVLSLLFSVVLYHFATHELSEGLQHQYQRLTTNDHDGDNNYSPRRELNTHNQNLLVDLAYFNLAVIVGSTVVSYWLARRTLRPIEQAHAAQVRFTTEASHELRTPLAAMRADTEVALMEKGLSVKARRTLQGNASDITKLERLASHLLDISRYQTDREEAQELVNLDEIIAETLRQFQHTIKAKHLKIKQNIKPVQVRGDSYGLGQLLAIVLDNAVKYSSPSGIITIKLQVENGQAVLAIKDTGIGIPANDLPHLFERFYRASNAKSVQNAASGYGLGLPLAQEIVRAHKGTIDIASQENKDTTLIIK
ncbi:MAG: sensor histidine kinase, partial [Candidatus Saccharimonadales bacterium]